MLELMREDGITCPHADQLKQLTETSRMPVDGPHRIYIDPTPSGVALDVSHFIGSLLRQLAEQAEEDPDGVLSDLREIAELDRAAHGDDSHAGHERDVRVDQLLDEIGGGQTQVHGKQLWRLIDRLTACAGPHPISAPNIQAEEDAAA